MIHILDCLQHTDITFCPSHCDIEKHHCSMTTVRRLCLLLLLEGPVSLVIIREYWSEKRLADRSHLEGCKLLAVSPPPTSTHKYCCKNEYPVL